MPGNLRLRPIHENRRCVLHRTDPRGRHTRARALQRRRRPRGHHRLDPRRLRRAAAVQGARALRRACRVQHDAAARRVGGARCERPGQRRGIPCARRLRGPLPRAFDDAGGNRRGSGAKRHTRQGRRGLSDWDQVAQLPKRAFRAQVPHLQRHRRRPRRLRGRPHHGELPARDHRGHGHRRARHRRRGGLPVRAQRLRQGARAPAGRNRRRTRGGHPGRFRRGVGPQAAPAHRAQRRTVHLRRDNGAHVVHGRQAARGARELHRPQHAARPVRPASSATKTAKTPRTSSPRPPAPTASGRCTRRASTSTRMPRSTRCSSASCWRGSMRKTRSASRNTVRTAATRAFAARFR